MPDITLGACGITVNRLGFGALPLQRLGMPEAVSLLRAAAHAFMAQRGVVPGSGAGTS